MNWIVFNGHSTAMVILGRPRERGWYIGNQLSSNFYDSLMCPEDRHEIAWLITPSDGHDEMKWEWDMKDLGEAGDWTSDPRVSSPVC